jgi:VWFA-related protein
MAVRRFIWLVLAIVLPPQGLWAQTPASSPATPAIKVTTRLVVLNVVVRDKSGKIVSNLGRDDFTILENDQRQSIDTFEALSGLSADTEQPPAIDATAASFARPRTILVLDELNTIYEDMMFA